MAVFCSFFLFWTIVILLFHQPLSLTYMYVSFWLWIEWVSWVVIDLIWRVHFEFECPQPPFIAFYCLVCDAWHSILPTADNEMNSAQWSTKSVLRHTLIPERRTTWRSDSSLVWVTSGLINFCHLRTFQGVVPVCMLLNSYFFNLSPRCLMMSIKAKDYESGYFYMS